VTKRANREGTIYKRPNGTWAAQVTVDGKRLTKYAKTQRECRQWLKETLGQIDQGLTAGVAKITLEQYLLRWLETVKSVLRPNTYLQYVQVCRDHIIPKLGKIRLRDLRPDHIQTLYSIKLDEGLSARSLETTHAILHKALKQALIWSLITRNPAELVRKPRRIRKEMRYWTADQVRQFLAAAKNNRLYALFYLAITTGLRQAELLGLMWSDLDQDKGTLSIQRQVYRVAGQGLVFTEPKTAAGRRSIVLSRADLDILKQHRTRQLEERLLAGSKWQEQNLIFTSRRGTPIDSSTMTCRDFADIINTANVPKIRFHDLRHTAATLMLQSGVHPKVVQERLGHADIKVTLNTYSHVLPSMQEDAAEKISKLING
jgi:integrase